LAKKKILTVIGTRPQFIKYSILSEKLKNKFNEILVDTGQHYSKNLSEYLIKELKFKKPKYLLGVKDPNPINQVSSMITKLWTIAEKEKPEFMVCFGDTNSTLSAAIVSAKMDVPIVHIESGERNFDMLGKIVHPSSIPEETNRIIADELSSLLLCSSRRAVKNLAIEKIKGEIVFTGDIMYDLFLKNAGIVKRNTAVLNNFNLKPKAYYYCTIHRAINTDNKKRLKNICLAVANLDKPVIFPVHPRTSKSIKKHGLYYDFKKIRNLKMVNPIGYKDSLSLCYNSSFVLTDSGGVIREAYFSGVPSIMLDSTSEWRDLYVSGWSTLAGADTFKILNTIANFVKPGNKPAFFGNGNAVKKTIKSIINWSN